MKEDEHKRINKIERELKQLKEETNDNTDKIETITSSLSSIEDSLNQLDSTVNELKSDVNSIDEDADETRDELFRINDEIRSVKQRIHQIETELDITEDSVTVNTISSSDNTLQVLANLPPEKRLELSQSKRQYRASIVYDHWDSIGSKIPNGGRKVTSSEIKTLLEIKLNTDLAWTTVGRVIDEFLEETNEVYHELEEAQTRTIVYNPSAVLE